MSPHTPNDADWFIETCNECQRMCWEAASHCVTLGAGRVDVHDVEVLQKCARICRNSAASFAVRSSLRTQISAACERLCEQSAEVCDTFAKDRLMAACAALCRVCAESCRQVAGEAPVLVAEVQGAAV